MEKKELKKDMKEKIKTIISDYVKQNDYVTYPEIERLFEKNGYDYAGKLVHTKDNGYNIIFWAGWKEEAFKILSELEKAGKIYMHPSSTLHYLITGKCLTFPVVTQIRPKRYKKDHWLPICFRPIPLP